MLIVKIVFSPQRSDAGLLIDAVPRGILVNGITYDASNLGAGERSDQVSDLISSVLRETDGSLVWHILLPTSDKPSTDAAFPEAVELDGPAPVDVPGHERERQEGGLALAQALVLGEPTLDEAGEVVQLGDPVVVTLTPTRIPLAERVAKALADVDAEHQAALYQLTGNPSQAERDTWSVKTDLSSAVLAGQALTHGQELFCQMRGLTTDESKKAYALEVAGNSAKFMALVGLADKVRSDCKARLVAVKSDADYMTAGEANYKQLAQAKALALGAK